MPRWGRHRWALGEKYVMHTVRLAVGSRLGKRRARMSDSRMRAARHRREGKGVGAPNIVETLASWSSEPATANDHDGEQSRCPHTRFLG